MRYLAARIRDRVAEESEISEESSLAPGDARAAARFLAPYLDELWGAGTMRRVRQRANLRVPNGLGSTLEPASAAIDSAATSVCRVPTPPCFAGKSVAPPAAKTLSATATRA